MNKRKKLTTEKTVAKLRDADVMLNSGKDVAAVLQSLEIRELTYQRLHRQY
jgi:putative transposase